MQWLSTNAADLVGHTVVILVFLGGFIRLRRQSQLERAKDMAIKQYDRSTDSIEHCTRLMEPIRICLWKLSISPFDRDAPLDAETDARSEVIGDLRADLFGSSIFIPPVLAQSLETVEEAFDSFTNAITRGTTDEKKRVNKRASSAISDWRVLARKWHRDEWKTLQSESPTSDSLGPPPRHP